MSGKAVTASVARLMYAYGDDESPLPESVEVVEGMVLDFVEAYARAAARRAAERAPRHHAAPPSPLSKEPLLVSADDVMEVAAADAPGRHERARFVLDMHETIRGATDLVHPVGGGDRRSGAPAERGSVPGLFGEFGLGGSRASFL